MRTMQIASRYLAGTARNHTSKPNSSKAPSSENNVCSG
jgi:hypothetical protein